MGTEKLKGKLKKTWKFFGEKKNVSDLACVLKGNEGKGKCV